MVNRIRALRTFPLVMGVIGMSIALILCGGCMSESNQPTGSSAVSHMAQLDRFPDTLGCTSTSAMLQVSQNLTLSVRNSEARFQSNSVPIPTLVSFGICDIDTPMPGLSFKSAVFGPLPLLQLLQPMEVRLKLIDAGLPASARDGDAFKLCRQNDVTGTWDFVLLAQVHGDEVRYEVTRFGKYVLGMATVAIDTTWNIIGLIPPTGGTVTLLTSRIIIPPGAVNATTPISFSITNTSPQGLPGSTNRVFDFGPEGTVFNVPVTLHVSFEDAGMGGEKVRPVRFYYYNTSTSSWERQPTEVDWTAGELVVTLSHFSRYAFGR